MRRMHRIVLLAGLVALAPVLAGCEDFDMDKFDFLNLNEKKKLTGERKELFPRGRAGRDARDSARIPERQSAAAGHGANAGAGCPRTAAAPRRQNAAAPAPPAKTAAIEPAAEPSRKPSRSASRSRTRRGIRQSRTPRSPRRKVKTTGQQQQSSPWPDPTALAAAGAGRARHIALAVGAAARHLLALMDQGLARALTRASI